MESLRKVGRPTLGRFTQTLILRKSPFSCCASARRQGTQRPLALSVPYKELCERRKRECRSEVIDTMNNAALKFVCYEKKDVPDFINETVKSKKWSTTFGLSPELSDATSNPTIQALIRAYKESGNKEKAAETRKRAAGQKAKIFIGNSVKNSRISLTGEFTSDQFKHRTDAAKSILVVSPRMQMNGVDCCQLWQWTTLTDCCRNCLVALQTR